MIEARKTYTNIGHDDLDSILWVLHDGIIDTRKFEYGLDHGDIWGDKLSNSYKGRFEPSTKKVSVVPPDFKHYIHSSVIDKLKEKFGHDIDVVEFGGDSYQYNTVLDELR